MRSIWSGNEGKCSNIRPKSNSGMISERRSHAVICGRIRDNLSRKRQASTCFRANTQKTRHTCHNLSRAGEKSPQLRAKTAFRIWPTRKINPSQPVTTCHETDKHRRSFAVQCLRDLCGGTCFLRFFVNEIGWRQHVLEKMCERCVTRRMEKSAITGQDGISHVVSEARSMHHHASHASQDHLLCPRALKRTPLPARRTDKMLDNSGYSLYNRACHRITLLVSCS